LLRTNYKDTALIELDGKPVEVTFPNLLGFDQQTSVNVNNKNYKIKLARNDRLTAFKVEVNGRLFTLQLEAKHRGLHNKASLSTPHLGITEKAKPSLQKSGAVRSVMPGKVVLLKVKEGDKVSVGDPLCVLEAMKMENEIVAPKEGIVQQVRVEQGTIVDKGDVLVVID